VYLPLLDLEAPGWDETYQMLAATRLAEIYAARGDYETAVLYQNRARDFYHREYLIDWVLEGRMRYFQRLANGEESVRPTILTGSPDGAPNSTPQ
jgi:hypothetical protein